MCDGVGKSHLSSLLRIFWTRRESSVISLHFAELGDASLSRSELNFANSEIGAKRLHCRLVHPVLFAKVFQVANAPMAYALWTLKFKFRRRKCTVAGTAFQWLRSQLSKLCTHTHPVEPNVTITMLIGSVLRSKLSRANEIMRKTAASSRHPVLVSLHAHAIHATTQTTLGQKDRL